MLELLRGPSLNSCVFLWKEKGKAWLRVPSPLCDTYQMQQASHHLRLGTLSLAISPSLWQHGHMGCSKLRLQVNQLTALCMWCTSQPEQRRITEAEFPFDKGWDRQQRASIRNTAFFISSSVTTMVNGTHKAILVDGSWWNRGSNPLWLLPKPFIEGTHTLTSQKSSEKYRCINKLEYYRRREKHDPLGVEMWTRS